MAIKKILLFIFVFLVFLFVFFIAVEIYYHEKEQLYFIEEPEQEEQKLFSEKILLEQDNELMYIINAKYPYFESKEFSQANEEIQNFILGIASDFKQNTEEQIIINENQDYSELIIDYSVIRTEKSFLSIEFSVFSLYSKAVHPMSSILTFNYNLKDNSLIEISDCFNDLFPVSEYVKIELENKLLGQSFWLEGAEPKEENYKSFTIKENSFEIIFNPYQVAPYVQGITRIDIPFDYFKDQIICNFVLEK